MVVREKDMAEKKDPSRLAGRLLGPDPARINY
jgi:hypothetical protein